MPLRTRTSRNLAIATSPRHRPLGAGVDGVPDAVPEEVEGQGGDQQRETGGGEEPPRRRGSRPAPREHPAPVRGGGRRGPGRGTTASPGRRSPPGSAAWCRRSPAPARWAGSSTNMIRGSPAPRDRAASTYSRSLIESTWPRTMRATEAQLKNPITSTVMVRLGPVMETRAMATSRNGMQRTTSMSRARRVSTMPPRKPAAMPDHDADHDRQQRSRPRRRPARPGRRRRRGPACRGPGRRCRTRRWSSVAAGRPSTVRPSGNCSFGGWPVRWTKRGAATAISAISTITTRETIATRSRRSRCHASCHGLRPSMSRPGRSRRSRGRAPAARSCALLRDLVERRSASISGTRGRQVLAQPQRVEAGRPVLGASSRTGTSGGTSRRAQSHCALGHRGWKRQPGGGSTGDGMSPASTIRSRLSARPGRPAAGRRAGRSCTGAGRGRRSRCVGAISTILPRYITAIRSLTCRTTDRSWEMKT